MVVYEVVESGKGGPGSGTEFNDKDEARELAETMIEAQLITWAIHPNLPGCLPAIRYNSCALEVWCDRSWKKVNIHGGW